MASTRRRTAPQLPEQEDDGIGLKLRQRRTIKGLSLQEVADRADVSIGLLSQIERGVTTPSLRSLRQVCQALDMPVGWLFDRGEGESNEIVIRANARRTLTLGPKGMTKELMSPDSMTGIQMMRIVIQPGGGSGDLPYNNGAGSKCGTVLSGSLGLEVAGETLTLQAGDSFAFLATDLHRFWCVGDHVVDIIWVVSPALY